MAGKRSAGCLGFATGLTDTSDLLFLTTWAGKVLYKRRLKQVYGKVGLPYGSNPATCPVRALQEWLRGAAITSGSLFVGINRHGTPQERLLACAVALIVKKVVTAAGLNPDLYAGHSLRAGLATSAAMAGVSERAIMAQTGHRSVQMVRRYIRDGSLFRENAAAAIGL